MCIICVEFKKKKLTLSEAINNYNEMQDELDPEHAEEVYYMLNDAVLEDTFRQVDDDDILDEIDDLEELEFEEDYYNAEPLQQIGSEDEGCYDPYFKNIDEYYDNFQVIDFDDLNEIEPEDYED